MSTEMKRVCHKDTVFGNVQLLATILHLAGSASEYLFLATVDKQFKASMPVVKQTSYRSIVQSSARVSFAMTAITWLDANQRGCFMRALAVHGDLATNLFAADQELLFGLYFLPLLYRKRRHDLFIDFMQAAGTHFGTLDLDSVLDLAIRADDHETIRLLYKDTRCFIFSCFIGLAIRRSQPSTIKLIVEYCKHLLHVEEYMSDIRKVVRAAETEEAMQTVTDKIAALENTEYDSPYPNTLFSLAAENSNIPLMRYLHASGKCIDIDYIEIRQRAVHYQRQVVLDFLNKDCGPINLCNA